MRRVIRAAGVAVLMWATLAIAGPATAFAASGTTYCTDGLAPGRYGHVIVPAGAACFSDGPVSIRRGLDIQPGATFVMGSEEDPEPNGTINGGVHSRRAASVQIHFMTINGGINNEGGSGPFGGPFDITWNAIEDNTINGDVRIDGYDGFWFGFIRNNVVGNVILTNNVSTEDADSNEYVTNTIDGDLKCFGNSPAPQIGDSEGEFNIVTGNKVGQCADL